MKSTKWILYGFLAVFLTSAVVSARAKEVLLTPEQQAAMVVAQVRGAPSDAHKALEPYVGKWTAKVKFWMKPGDKVQESVGTSDILLIFGGRFLQQNYHGTMMIGIPFDGMGITGYDNVRAEYQTLWIDNMMTGFMLGTGSFDTASKTLKTTGDFGCPMTNDKHTYYRTEMKSKDADHFTYTSYGKAADGKEFRNMEIAYTRVKQG